MKRRSFVKASLISSAAASMLPKANMAEPAAKKSSSQLYDLRVYTFKDDTQQKVVEDYFQNAAIPALNRIGSNNVGVFTELKPTGQTKLYVLIPYNSADDFLKAEGKLAADTEYNQQAAAPVYDRIETSLLQAFSHMPKLEAPEKKQRLFELRRYESPTEAAGKRKIRMFNEGSEMPIFSRLGLKPVFYSETLVGAYRPNLVYMVTFDNMDAHDRLWKAFGSDPDWVKLKSMPEYPDAIVSHITSTFLVPAAYSQI